MVGQATLRRNVLARRARPDGITSDDDPTTLISIPAWISEEETAYGSYPDILAYWGRDRRSRIYKRLSFLDVLDGKLSWEELEKAEESEDRHEIERQLREDLLYELQPGDEFHLLDNLPEKDIRATLINHKLRLTSIDKFMRRVALFGAASCPTLVLTVDPLALDTATPPFTKRQLEDAACSVHESICIQLDSPDARFLVEVENPDRLTSMHPCNITQEWADTAEICESQNPMFELARARLPGSLTAVGLYMMDQPGPYLRTKAPGQSTSLPERLRPTVGIFCSEDLVQNYDRAMRELKQYLVESNAPPELQVQLMVGDIRY